MLAYQIMGIAQVPELSESEINERLDRVEEHIETVLAGHAPTPLEEGIGAAMADLSMVAHTAAEHLRRRILPGIDLQGEDVTLAILAHPDLTAAELAQIGHHHRSIAVTAAITRHRACGPEVYAELSERGERHRNHHYLKAGRQRVLWEASPYGAAAAALSTLRPRHMVRDQEAHRRRVRELGDGGYGAVETFLALVQDAQEDGAFHEEDRADELVEKAVLLTP